jgi:dipicolinate synthase subunit B
MIDIILVLPCTGNTLAKLTHGITDTPVLMAIKSHIRNNKPVVLGVSTNDGLGANAENIGRLLNAKNIYFIPFTQDEPQKKPKSLVCDYSKVVETLKEAMAGKQIQPVLI